MVTAWVTPGTVVVDTSNTYLYYVIAGGKAIRYGIGVGREGFTWSGVRTVDHKSEWPDWVPPAEMIQRYFVSELTGLGAPTFTAVIGLFW